jgi:hypothetical protein
VAENFQLRADRLFGGYFEKILLGAFRVQHGIIQVWNDDFVQIVHHFMVTKVSRFLIGDKSHAVVPP